MTECTKLNRLKIPRLQPRDRSINLPTLYHVSPHIFNRPLYTQCVSKARSESKHPNGVLGLWASPKPGYFDSSSTFGPHVYHLELSDDCNQVLLSYDDLRGWDRNLSSEEDCHYEIYQSLRDDLLEAGIDVMFVHDGLHNVGEVIIVNLDAISTFYRTTEYSNSESPLTREWRPARTTP